MLHTAAVSVVLPWDAAAMYQGNGQRDNIHRVYKVKVTEDVRAWTGHAHLQAKRDGDSCPTSYSLCAASLGGDCCPDNYACAQSSCYATTAAVSVCASQTGYFACPLSVNGGCCPQGLVCGSDGGCSSPAGATHTQTCPAGKYLCAASFNGGCCASGMGCALLSCYSLHAATATLTYTTTEGGSAVTITATSVTTSTPTDLATATGDGVVAKYYPSTVSKTEATATAGLPSSGGGSGDGLSKGAIGGIVAAAAIILIAVLAAAFFIIKRLKHTEQVVQTYRETTSGTRTRETTENKKSSVNVRVVPTPFEVDAFDYDPLMMNSSVASPLRPGQRRPPPETRTRRRGGSDTASSQLSLWSGQSATRWPTPSVDVEPDYDNGGRTAYFELPPPRAHRRPDGRRPPAMRQSVNSNDSSAYSYHDFTYAHGRNMSDSSELSAGSDNLGSPQQHGGGSPPLMPIELGVDGEFRPELPGSESESTSGGGRWHAPGREGTAAGINDLVSPVSMRPGTAQTSLPRRRGDGQAASPTTDGQTVVAGAAASILGSIAESVSVAASHSLHGHYGPDIGEGEVDTRNSSPLPGLVPLERPSQDGSERQ